MWCGLISVMESDLDSDFRLRCSLEQVLFL